MSTSNLRIGHLNVRGLECSIDGVKLLLDKQNYHLFGLTETKMKQSAPVGPVRIPGYNFIRHCLPSKRGRGSKTFGGVALYVKKGIKATPILKSSFDTGLPIASRFEFLAVQIKVNNLNICVVVVYNPSGANQLFAASYEKLLLDLLDFGFDRTFIIGDYNINVGGAQQCFNATNLRTIHNTFNLTVLKTPPTRITERSSTTIDLLVTDSPQTIRRAGTSSANDISDHEIVFLIADIRVPPPSPVRSKVRNFRRIDPVRLQADFVAKDWEPFYRSDSAEVKSAFLSSELQSLLDQHAPEKTIIIRDKRTPWITTEIEHAIEVRNLAFSLFSRNPNRSRGDVQWVEYTRQRDRVKSLIFVAKKKYADKHFSCDLPAKQLWNNLKREGIHNPSKNNVAGESLDGDQLNRFFADGHRSLQPHQHINIDQPAEDQPQVLNRDRPAFRFRHTDAEDVSRKMWEIGSNATGCDNIPISFIKLLSPFILPVLVHLFNTIIDTDTFPSCWKKAIVTPIPKSSNPTEPKDFRPISVLPAVSKILEKILLAQISDYLESSNPALLAKHQSGYRKNHSTTTALTKVVHDIYGGFDNNCCTVMVLVDFSVAFNSVNHRKLRGKLEREFGLSDSACNLLSSFLSNRSQVVKVGDLFSGEQQLTDGTPQGSCLSALLFSLYINSLPNSLQCQYHLYADDLQIYVTGPAAQIDQLIAKINADLAAIEHWALINSLAPNPKKTQAIIFSRDGSVTPQSNIVFCNEIILPADNVINLGLNMDKNLNWCKQVNDVVAKVYGTLRTFRRFAPVLPAITRQKLVQAVVAPLFTYCDVIYFPGLNATLKDRLHRCFKSSIRFVHRLRSRDTTVAVRNCVFGRDLPDNYRHRICCYLRKGFFQELPQYIQEHLQRGQMQRSRSFVVPRHSTQMKKSVLVYGVCLWNSLPLEIKMKPTLNAFKKSL